MAIIQVQVGKNILKDVLINKGARINIITIRKKPNMWLTHLQLLVYLIFATKFLPFSISVASC